MATETQGVPSATSTDDHAEQSRMNADSFVRVINERSEILILSEKNAEEGSWQATPSDPILPQGGQHRFDLKSGGSFGRFLMFNDKSYKLTAWSAV